MRDDVSAFSAPWAWHDVLVHFHLAASHGGILMRIPLMVWPISVACLAFVPAWEIMATRTAILVVFIPLVVVEDVASASATTVAVVILHVQ